MSNQKYICVILVIICTILHSVGADRSWNNRAYSSSTIINTISPHKSQSRPIPSHLSTNAIRKPRTHRRRQSSQQPQSQQLSGSLTLPEVTQEYPEAQYRFPPSSSPSSSSSSSSSSSIVPSTSLSSGKINQQTIDDAQQSAIAVYQTYLSQKPMISVKNQMLYKHQMLPHQLPFQIAASNPSSSNVIANEKKLNQLAAKSRKQGQWW